MLICGEANGEEPTFTHAATTNYSPALTMTVIIDVWTNKC